jgi:hypothetical protein
VSVEGVPGALRNVPRALTVADAAGEWSVLAEPPDRVPVPVFSRPGSDSLLAVFLGRTLGRGAQYESGGLWTPSGGVLIQVLPDLIRRRRR